MKTWISALAIVSLVMVGTLVVYREALAKTPFCWQCEDYCTYCGGYYSVDVETCWWMPPWQYCQVHCQYCTNPQCQDHGGYPYGCGTTICIMDPPI